MDNILAHLINFKYIFIHLRFIDYVIIIQRKNNLNQSFDLFKAVKEMYKMKTLRTVLSS